MIYRLNDMKTELIQIKRGISGHKGKYAILSLIFVLSACVALFVISMINSAGKLYDMMNVPYKEYYSVTQFNNSSTKVESDIGTDLGISGVRMRRYFEYFEIVDDVLLTAEYKTETKLAAFNAKLASNKKEVSTLIFTEVPNSEYDEAFRRGDKVLISGRHLTQNDYRAEKDYVIIDEELAELNSLKVGDTFVTDYDDVKYTVIGIYRTLNYSGKVVVALDVPANLLFTSHAHEDAKILTSYDFYVKFKNGTKKEDAYAFFDAFIDTEIMGIEYYAGLNGYEMKSVEDLNREQNSGFYSLLLISVSSGIFLLLVVLVSVIVYSFVMYKKRERELLLYSILGKKKWKVHVGVLVEHILIVIPSVILGIVACRVFFIDLLVDIVAYFEKMISVENVHATTSLAMLQSRFVSESIKVQITEFEILNFSLIIIGAALALLLLSNAVTYVSYKRKSPMTILSERK